MTVRAPTFSLIAVLILCFSTLTSAFQAREHFTPQEIDLIKDAQELDKRIDIFIKAAERRMLVLNASNPDAAMAKQLKKDSESWGELPTGSRGELIADIAGILDEAITNIDDVSMRDEKNPLIAKALRKLAASAAKLVEQLKPAETAAKPDAELSSFDQLSENAESILQAANKLPPPSAAEKKGNKKTNQ